jgi:hypothetical protein
MATLKNTTINGTGSMSLPAGTTSQRPSVPNAGYTRFNSTLNTAEIYNGSIWISSGITNYNKLRMYMDPAQPSSYSGSGSSMFDLINPGVVGMFQNSPTYSSNNGGYITYNGSNQGIRLPGNNLSLNSMTISSWNISTNYSQNGFMFEKTTNGSVNTQYSLFYNGDGLMYYRTVGPSVQDLTVTSSSVGVVASQWNNIVATFDGVYKKIYVNGKQVTQSAALTGSVTANNTGDAFIGCYGNVAGHFFNGSISATFVSNVAWSATEVRNHFNALRWRYNI